MLKFFFLSLIITTNSFSENLNKLDFSKKGLFQVEVYSFRNLVDRSREKVTKSEKFRFFKRRKSEESLASGRQIPIKIHLPKAEGAFPVIIISHGAGGNWDTHFAQADHLASHGFAVLCIEHVGSNTERMKRSIRIFQNLKDMTHDSKEVLARPKDISFAIEQATEWNKSDKNLKGKFDLNHIGVMGHSFGAYTTLAIAGARPALEWIEPKVGSGSGLGPDLSDKRVLCGVALSPQGPGEPFFIKQSFESLNIPLLGISGTNDKVQSGEAPLTRFESFKLWPDMQNKNIFLWLNNASHLDFTDSKGGEEHGIDSSSREDVQKIVRAATLMYFNQCLKSSQAQENQIAKVTLESYLSKKINKFEIISK